jgi:hypothetical protein
VIDDGLIESLKAAGAQPDVIAAAKRNKKPIDDDLWIYEENWDAFAFFLDVDNHWHVAIGMTGKVYLGLNWSSIESVMRSFKSIPKSKRSQLYDDLRIIERAALSVLNKAKE